MPSRPTFRPILRGLGRAAGLLGILAFLPIGTVRSGEITYVSTDVPKSIPDNDLVGITSVLVVPDSFVITDVDLIFDELLHESVSDLSIELTSPSGTTVVLVKSASEGGILSGLGVRDNFIRTIFDDDAPTNLRDAFFDNHEGTYNIDHPSVGTGLLSRFDGENALGTWILRISDHALFDTGELDAWSLHFSSTSVPEPGGIVLLGLGLAGARIIDRRRRRR